MDLMALVPDELPFQDELFKVPGIIPNDEIAKEEDEVDSLVGGNRFIDKIRRWIIRKSILSRNHPITRICIKSSAAIKYEIDRHLRNYPYMIYPFSEIRSFWECFFTIFTVVSLVIVPIILAFDFHTSENSIYIIILVDIGFAVDMILRFFTGHYDNHTRIIILDRKIIASKYFKGFFIFDFLSMFPMEIVCIIATGSWKPKWYYASINLMKIFRLRSIVLYSRKISDLYRISFQKYKIYEMSMIIILCIHWATCLELYVALVGAEINGKRTDRGSWLTSELIKDKNTNLKIYLACANRATVSLASSSHYLDMKTTEDIVLNLVLTVVGKIGFIYIIVQFLQLMTTFQSTTKRSLKLLRQLQEYMQYKELPPSIQRRLLNYYNYYNKKRFERDKHIIEQVSPHLREELLLYNYSRLVDHVLYFRHLPQSIIAQIVAALGTEIYLPNDTIVEAGTYGDSLYFIASGTVAVYASDGQEVCHLEDGAHFGEVSLVIENERRTASVVAVEICEIWILKRTDFLSHITPFPKLLNRLQKIAVDLMEKNLRRQAYRFDGENYKKKSNLNSLRKYH